MIRVQTLNNISSIGLAELPAGQYQIANDVADPHVLLVRSASLHGKAVPPSVRAVGRAGAGVNNIPIADYTAAGVPVFNTPGANANAVKELVIAGMLIASRNLMPAWAFARGLEGSDDELHKAVEAGKKHYVGSELLGKSLTVVGLGAIGRLVASTAVAFGMRVTGFDPALPADAALPPGVRRAASLDESLDGAELVSVHVPLSAATKGLLGADRIARLADGAIVLNFAREGVVDEAAMVAALDAGQARAYVSDFPVNATKNHPKCVTLPHLGASTEEAEENCAVMVARQIHAFLTDGTVVNSVNFPALEAPRRGAGRLAVAHAHDAAVSAAVAAALTGRGVHPVATTSASRADLTYTLIDTEAPLDDQAVAAVAAVAGVRRATRL